MNRPPPTAPPPAKIPRVPLLSPARQLAWTPAPVGRYVPGHATLTSWLAPVRPAARPAAESRPRGGSARPAARLVAALRPRHPPRPRRPRRPRQAARDLDQPLV